ncbi:hypothetical protein RHGRI_029831 [Rhododendron griersonianum]|uniref:Glycine-rich protein n=1 Tax=Rhododendron griersonianum TaxID=479676 RepID=A0AAV6IRS5_9ERIC|nr:hypothetical protein RHGRI_029831 [Rhododendron griersonianum]
MAGGYGLGFVMRLEMKSGLSSSPVFGSEKIHPDLPPDLGTSDYKSGHRNQTEEDRGGGGEGVIVGVGEGGGFRSSEEGVADRQRRKRSPIVGVEAEEGVGGRGGGGGGYVGGMFGSESVCMYM